MWAAVLCALCTSILWGVSYSVLPQIKSKLGMEAINLVYGGFLALTSVILLFSRHKQGELGQLVDSEAGWLILQLALYVVLSVVASFLFLFGYQYIKSDENPGIYNVIGGTYPVIIFLISYFYWHKDGFNPWLGVSGVLLTLIGTGLLASA